MSAPGEGAWPPALVQLHDACHRAQRYCHSLQRWGPRAGLRSGRDRTRAWAGLLLHDLDAELPLFFHHQHELLLPALMEAVAGSDPVCLRGMAADHDAGRRQVLHAWTALRPGLATLANGDHSEMPAATVDAFTSGYLALLSHAENELLPMAERLLSDAQWEDLGRALRASSPACNG